METGQQPSGVLARFLQDGRKPLILGLAIASVTFLFVVLLPNVWAGLNPAAVRLSGVINAFFAHIGTPVSAALITVGLLRIK